jgi:hypothetical protein
MRSLDRSQCPGVERIPGKVSGAWVFTGTRTPVAIVFENLEDGMTITPPHVRQATTFAFAGFLRVAQATKRADD